MDIYNLVDAVVAAVREYDKTKDHLRHSASETDCIRCKLVASLPPYAQSRVAIRRVS